MKNDNRLRPDDFDPAPADCRCYQCDVDIREGEDTVRVSYRGVVKRICRECAIEQIGMSDAQHH